MQQFLVLEDKNIEPSEFARLMGAAGYGREGDYDKDVIERSLAAYPFVAYAQNDQGQLLGYVSAFSDGAFSTFIGELVVRPDAEDAGIGPELLRRVERRYPGIPIYAHAFAEEQSFFIRNGYRVARRPMTVLFKQARSH